MGIFDFLKRKPKSKAKNYGQQRVIDDTKRPQTAFGIPQPIPAKPGQQRHETATVVPPATKTKPAEMPKPPKGTGGIPKAVAATPAESAARRRRRDWKNDQDDYDYTPDRFGVVGYEPLGDADFDGTPNIVDNTPYGGSDSYCAPQTESSSSWTSDSSSSGCYDSESSSSYDSGSSSSYDSGSSSSYDSGSSSCD